MKKLERPLSLSLKIVSIGFALLLAGCGPEVEQQPRGAVLIPVPDTTDASNITIDAISTKPWLVTGGDVLVDITVAQQTGAGTIAIELNGENITSGFRQIDNQSKYQGLVSGLVEGDNKLLATMTATGETKSLTLTNYPISGPIISGPHEQPFFCQSQDFQLANGEYLGAAMDSNCQVNTRYDYVYWSAEEEIFKPYPLPVVGVTPADLAQLTLDNGRAVPFIVRVETGTVNRAIYEIAMLHDPAEPEPDPWTRSSGYNGKLVYTHGGGCRGGWFQQGDRTGGVLRKGLIEMGYAVTSASLNVFGQNCNDLLASETHIMVKERFIEHYGVPEYTIGTGGSGGSYQSHQTADNYPGVFDGIIVSSSFPDVTTATIFTLADARLLNYYFTQINAEDFTPEQQRAVAGFGAWGSIPNLARGAARLDPVYEFATPLEEQGGEISIEALQSDRYHYTNPDGIRATVYDHTVNVYGTVDGSSVAGRPLDNTGVQYGLAALNESVITTSQFIQLNRDIGGFDRDMNHVPRRHQADSKAARRAIESGRILFGGAGLSETPVIDYRTYTDNRENGDIHMIVHQFSTRQRMLNANGHTDNHVMSIGGLWGFTPEEPDLGGLFQEMDAWLMAIANDNTGLDKAITVSNTRPVSLTDNCWETTPFGRNNIREPLSIQAMGRCAELYPAFKTPRHVAGAPLANDIVSCQLKPIDPTDYGATLSTQELVQLQQIFPEGVCDWSRADKHNVGHQGTWLSFGPSPINRIQ